MSHLQPPAWSILTAPDLLLGVAGCPFPARPEGLGGSQQGEGYPFPRCLRRDRVPSPPPLLTTPTGVWEETQAGKGLVPSLYSGAWG